MAWVTVAAIGGSALLGAYMQNRQAKAQQEAQKKSMLANAEQIQYSPWTRAQVQTQGPSSADPMGAAAGGALQGGLTGTLMASQFSKMKAAPNTQGNAGAENTEQKMANSPAFGMDMDENEQAMMMNPWNRAARMNRSNY